MEEQKADNARSQAGTQGNFSKANLTPRPSISQETTQSNAMVVQRTTVTGPHRKSGNGTSAYTFESCWGESVDTCSQKPSGVGKTRESSDWETTMRNGVKVIKLSGSKEAKEQQITKPLN